MKFQQIDLDTLLSELQELPSDWMDEVGRRLIEEVRFSMAKLRDLGGPITVDHLTAWLQESPAALDVYRLFFGKGQESVAHMLCDQRGGSSMTWARLRSLAKQDPERIAKALAALDLLRVITQHLSRHWGVEDILIERYKMSRGRAVAGQKRGRGLEEEVDSVLKGRGILFRRGVTFTGKKGETAKCDFAIPGKDHPKIIIESKGFEATGSKLTDFLGDVLKIAKAKDYHMYFFLVTDGRGWLNRVSDLKRLVEYHKEGLVDMIYTRSRLPDLAGAIEQICANE